MKDNLIQCIPTLQSNDALKSFEFYHDVLGFSKNWEHQFETGLPFFVSMSCGEFTVFLTEHVGESAFGAEIYFFVKDIEKLAKSIEAKGIKLDNELHDTPYGVREITLKDPDGNKLRIGQNLD